MKIKLKIQPPPYFTEVETDNPEIEHAVRQARQEFKENLLGGGLTVHVMANDAVISVEAIEELRTHVHTRKGDKQYIVDKGGTEAEYNQPGVQTHIGGRRNPFAKEERYVLYCTTESCKNTTKSVDSLFCETCSRRHRAEAQRDDCSAALRPAPPDGAICAKCALPYGQHYDQANNELQGHPFHLGDSPNK